MPPVLKIFIEASWRGPVLDTVSRVAEFPLASRASSGLKTVKENCLVTLTDGSSCVVWCAVTQYGEVKFSLAQEDAELFSLTTRCDFELEMRMSDKKLYVFELEKFSQVDQTTG
jgi:hypothetical protein